MNYIYIPHNLQELEQEGLYNSIDEVHRYCCVTEHMYMRIILFIFYRKCLAVVFLPLIEKELQEYIIYWNSHRIRSSRQGNCLGGIPNDLFEMPAFYGKQYPSLHE